MYGWEPTITECCVYAIRIYLCSLWRQRAIPAAKKHIYNIVSRAKGFGIISRLVYEAIGNAVWCVRRQQLKAKCYGKDT